MVASWTLAAEDWSLIANKSGVTRLGFAVLLKFFELEARFPASPDEVRLAAHLVGRQDRHSQPAVDIDIKTSGHGFPRRFRIHFRRGGNR